MEAEDEEDYGDYVTRCICEFKHDDGYMIQCDGCSVWQHVECMRVNPNNLPDKYLCEVCEPRPVDRRRAKQIQLKKREDLSDAEDNTASPVDHRAKSSLPSQGTKKKRKRIKVPEPKLEMKRNRKEKLEGKKQKRKQLPKTAQQPARAGSIQSLLNAASLLEDTWADVWNANASPWTDKYDTADHNRYSEPVRVFISSRLSQLKSEAVVYSHEEYCTMELRTPHPQCSLVEVQRRRKGVFADVAIREDDLVIEYNGKITVKHAVVSDMASGSKSLWKHKPCPFVYLYDKMQDIDICIDARHYGNLSRFIRRSCSPNSELRHFFVANELHFGVYALQSLAPGEEITLPFDFRYEKCDYPVECACGQKVICLVARANYMILNRRPGGGSKRSEEEQQSRSRGPSHQRSSLVVVQDEDSNSSWASTGSSRKRPRQQAPPFSPARQSSRQVSREASSESEEETESDVPKRRKSREERKTEAVWRMLEKMEASAQRKRQQLVSEGSVDSDTTSSPSTLHPTPLLTQKQKDCRSGSAPRKVQMFPGGKTRLSSVSSTDALSPANDLPETFSPPLTPRLGLQEVPYPTLGPHITPPPTITSPLTPSTPKPEFEITPYLHPKYLFADFALPFKKAILKQWENEQNGDSPHPFRNNGHSLSVYSYLGRENGRHRVRGCLKHRWLKQHNEQTDSSSNKENCREGEQVAPPLPHKKQVLLRWQKASSQTDSQSGVEASPSTSAKPPAAIERKLSSASESSMTGEPAREVPSSSCTSPLFDDFSDDEEFELLEKERASEKGQEGSGEEEEEEEEKEEGEGDGIREGPRTPPLEGPHTPPMDVNEDETGTPAPLSPVQEEDSNLSSISDTSLQSEVGEKEGAGSPERPRLPEESQVSSTGIEDGGKGSEQEEGSTVSELQSSEIGTEPHSETRVPGHIAPPEEESVSDVSHESTPLPSPPPQAMAEERVTNTRGADSAAKTVEDDTQKMEMELSSPEPCDKEMRPAPSAPAAEEEESVKDSTADGTLPENEEALNLDESTAEAKDSSDVEKVLRPPQQDQLLMEEGVGGGSSPDSRVTVSPTSAATASTAPSKTPGKKKINLSEYRNRARKPAEQRKPSSEKASPPHSTTPSFLAHTVSTTLLSTPSLLTSSYTHSSLVSGLLGAPSPMTLPTVLPGPAVISAVPQFEPVSPDDGDQTPPLVTMEDSSTLQGNPPQQPVAASRMVATITSYPAQGLIPADQALVQLPAQFLQQPPPHSSSQFVLDTRWAAPHIEHAPDPRRGAMPSGEIYSQQQMGAIHAGLLPHPAPSLHPPTSHPHPMMQQGMMPQHGEIPPPGMMHRPEYCPRQPVNVPPRPHGFVPHPQHRTVFRPRHPGPSSGYY